MSKSQLKGAATKAENALKSAQEEFDTAPDDAAKNNAKKVLDEAVAANEAAGEALADFIKAEEEAAAVQKTETAAKKDPAAKPAVQKAEADQIVSAVCKSRVKYNGKKYDAEDDIELDGQTFNTLEASGVVRAAD